MSGNGTQDDARQDDPVALARAFASARYHAELGGEPLDFGVGECVPEIEERLPASEYAFITAWNPDAESQPVVENTRSDDALVAGLDATRAPDPPPRAEAPPGGPPGGRGRVDGRTAERADAIGRDFAQAGILAWRAAEPVRLHMLMPRPDGADLPHVDWIE